MLTNENSCIIIKLTQIFADCKHILYKFSLFLTKIYAQRTQENQRSHKQ